MLGRILRFLPLGLAAWRWYQNRQRKNGSAQRRGDQRNTSQSTDHYGHNPRRD